MDIATYLDQQLRAAGIPIIGVRVLAGPDRTGWIVDYQPSATPAQKATAANLLASLTVDSPTLLDGDAKGDFDNNKALKALAIWTAQKLSIPLATARAEIVAIYKTL